MRVCLHGLAVSPPERAGRSRSCPSCLGCGSVKTVGAPRFLRFAAAKSRRRRCDRPHTPTNPRGSQPLRGRTLNHRCLRFACRSSFALGALLGARSLRSVRTCVRSPCTRPRAPGTSSHPPPTPPPPPPTPPPHPPPPPPPTPT